MKYNIYLNNTTIIILQLYKSKANNLKVFIHQLERVYLSKRVCDSLTPHYTMQIQPDLAREV